MRKNKKGHVNWKAVDFAVNAGIILGLLLILYFIAMKQQLVPGFFLTQQDELVIPTHIPITPQPGAQAIAWIEIPRKVRTGTTVPLILKVKN